MSRASSSASPLSAASFDITTVNPDRTTTIHPIRGSPRRPHDDPDRARRTERDQDDGDVHQERVRREAEDGLDVHGRAPLPLGTLEVGDGRTPTRRGGLGHDDTNSQPSSPNVFKISPGLCSSSGATKYSQTVTASPIVASLPFLVAVQSLRGLLDADPHDDVEARLADAMRYASSFTMSACSQSTLAPIATASRAISGVSSARRNTSTTSTRSSSGMSRSDG